MNDLLKKKYLKISTATVATILFKRGLRNQFIQGVVPLRKGRMNMVGPAFTLRYIPAREDLNTIEVFKSPEHPQRLAVEQCPEGAVLVIDSRKDARAASAGSILATRLAVRGAVGIVTDGGFRDASVIADLEIGSYHARPSAPTNLTLHQAVDINVPIGCGDAPVFPGDIILGDDDGLIVIPQEIAEEVAEEGLKMELFEEFVTLLVNEGRPIIGLYPPTDERVLEEFNKWQKERML